MQIDIIETKSPGTRSHLISAGGVAVVIDPPRDIDRVLNLARERRVVVALVAETHLHHDYASGGLELSRRVGAPYVMPAGTQVGYERVPAGDGDVLTAGPMRLSVVHTPGHTHHHVNYVLADAAGRVRAVFTGGSMLYGGTGRTDLDGPEHTLTLSRAQFHSVRRLATSLPAGTAVYPTQGFGSFCSATTTVSTQSTLGEQRWVNPALTLAEDAFVEQLLHGLSAYPNHYQRMEALNAAGPSPVHLASPREMRSDELVCRIANGEWVVDLRPRMVFAAGHLAGALNFELSNSLLPYLGWLYDWSSPLTLIGASERQVADARRMLVRIGIDRLAGAAVGEPAALAGGGALGSYDVSDFAGLAGALTDGPVAALDVRRHDERRWGGVRGSHHIQLHELPTRLDELPDDELWVYSGSGFRASIAASMLARAGRRVVLVNDRYGLADEGAAGRNFDHDPV